ncbi:MAG: copper homeostasis protein CutC [Gemmatimonadaceae bacterium]
MTLIEAAVDTLESALTAERAGAGRIELCASLSDAGTTPSGGLISAVTERVSIPVFVLIRTRGGDFVYGDDDIDVMTRDIELALSLGIRGIVLGALTANGSIHEANTRALVKASKGVPVTFHRAFDFTTSLSEALERLIDAGVQRVLTSGGSATALEGADTIARMVDQAGGRIIVMAGGGIRESNVREVIARTGVREIHARISSVAQSPTPTMSDRAVRLRKRLPHDENVWEELDQARMRSLIDLAQTSGMRGES